VDEAITIARAFFAGTRNAPPHDWLQVPGGAMVAACRLRRLPRLARRGAA